MYFKNKNVLVAGGTGLIGIPLVKILLEQGAGVRIVSLDSSSRAHPQAEFVHLDLTILNNCLKVCKGMDHVFNLLCVKGSPKIMATKPASVFYPMLTFNTQLMEAAWRCRVNGFLFTSTIGVYHPAEIFYEEDVWKTFPSPNDRFAGWVKRIGELQAEAYRIEHGWNNINIVRPSNVYGPYDNFDSDNAMVVPSLIKRATNGEDPFVVWGDGTAERDFIHAEDVARGMILVAEKNPGVPVNLGSGIGTPIKELVEIVCSNSPVKLSVVWDNTVPSGDRKRIMDISRATNLGFKPQIDLKEGIRDTYRWYLANRGIVGSRYDVFNQTA